MKVQFFARGEAHAQTKKIYCQLVLDNDQRDTPFSLRLTVPKQYWQPEQLGNWVNSEYFLAEKLNSQLKDVMTSFDDIMNLLRLSDEEISYQKVRECFDVSNLSMVQPKKKEFPFLLDIFDEMVETTGRKKKWRENTYKTYNSRRSNLVAFLTEKKLLRIRINEVRYKFFEAFEIWLLDRGDVCRNYANKILGSVKKTLSFAVNSEYLEHMTVGNLDLEYEPPKAPNYLLPADRYKIIAYEGKTYEKIRDISVFLMYTGFSWVDYQSLKQEHFQADGWKKDRSKSSIFSLPPILPQAQKIIDKYGSIDKLPQMHLTDFNKKIKFFGDKIGLTEDTVGFNLSSSVFRDTFCSMMENERCVDHRTLMAMMGHTNPKQIRNYSSLTPARIKHELEKQRGLTELKDL